MKIAKTQSYKYFTDCCLESCSYEKKEDKDYLCVDGQLRQTQLGVNVENGNKRIIDCCRMGTKKNINK